MLPPSTSSLPEELHVEDRALHDALKRHGLQRVHVSLAGDGLDVVVEERLKVSLESVDLDPAVTHDLGARVVKAQGVEQVLQGNVFMASSLGLLDRRVQCHL